MSGRLWIAAALLATAVIVALAAHGRRPEPGFVPFEAAGVMLHLDPARVVAVEIAAGARRWRFTRLRHGGWAASPSVATDPAAHLERGLRLLHASAPQRVLGPDELRTTRPADFGLDPPRYTVSIATSSSEAFAVTFGEASPQGLGQYARVAGREEVVLLPRFVGEPWEAVTGLRR